MKVSKVKVESESKPDSESELMMLYGFLIAWSNFAVLCDTYCIHLEVHLFAKCKWEHMLKTIRRKGKYLDTLDWRTDGFLFSEQPSIQLVSCLNK